MAANLLVFLTVQLSQQVRSSSDMWSFGVVVWEILTLGSLPYGDMTHQQIIINVTPAYYQSFLHDEILMIFTLKVCSGRTRLSTPVNTPLGLHRLLHRCWGLNPLERPSCEELVTVFTELHEAFASTDGPRPIILTTEQVRFLVVEFHYFFS
jgi:serine/threonine protein kinase